MESETRRDIIEIFEKGRDLTLATVREDGAPQATTVSYVSDGLSLYFGCGRTSQKAANLARDDRVSLTIDLPYTVWSEIRGVSLFGRARPIVDPGPREATGRLFRERFDEMAGLEDIPETLALFCITPQIISLLDYRQGFGHTVLVAAAELEALEPGPAAGDPWRSLVRAEGAPSATA